MEITVGDVDRTFSGGGESLSDVIEDLAANGFTGLIALRREPERGYVTMEAGKVELLLHTDGKKESLGHRAMSFILKLAINADCVLETSTAADLADLRQRFSKGRVPGLSLKVIRTTLQTMQRSVAKRDRETSDRRPTTEMSPVTQEQEPIVDEPEVVPEPVVVPQPHADEAADATAPPTTDPDTSTAPAQTSAAAGQPLTMRQSLSYLLLEEKPILAWSAAAEALEHGYKLMAISRTSPKRLKEKTPILEQSTLYWLTDRQMADDAITPVLESMMYYIEEFLEEEDPSLFVLDGLEYLISNHNFEAVLQFIRSIVDVVANSGCHVALFPLSPGILERSQLGLLQRELEAIDPEAEEQPKEYADWDTSSFRFEGGSETKTARFMPTVEESVSGPTPSEGDATPVATHVMTPNTLASMPDEVHEDLSPEAKKRSLLRKRVNEYKRKGYDTHAIESKFNDDLDVLWDSFVQFENEIRRAKDLESRLDKLVDAGVQGNLFKIRWKIRNLEDLDGVEGEISGYES